MSRRWCALDMKAQRLLLLGLVLVVMCNTVDVEEGAHEIQELGDSKDIIEDPDKPRKAKALDEAPKKSLMEHEVMNEKDLLPLPGMPDWAKVTKRIESVSKSQCKTMCDSETECAGFQYVAAEQLCQMFASPKTPDQHISLKFANEKAKKAVKKAVKEAKKKAGVKEKKDVKDVENAMAPKKKDASAGQKFREADKKMGLRQKEYSKAKKVAKEAARKSKGSRAAEIITKTHEHEMMLEELAAAKGAQAAGLNFEEQVIMAKSPTSKKVLLAKAHKTTEMQKEEKADAAFEEAKVVMKKGLALQAKMQERKVKRVEDMVRAKTKANKAEAKHKVAGQAYKAQERKEKNASDEKKEKLAAKARIFLKKQNKKSERHAKAMEAARGGDKEGKIKKCRKAQNKMRQLKFKLKRRLKRQIYKRERKVADRKVARLKKGYEKREKRKAAKMQKALVKDAKNDVRERFDMSEAELDEVMTTTTELGEGKEEGGTAELTAATQAAKMASDKAKVAAEFKKKEQIDAQNIAAEKSKEVGAKSEEVNALQLELAGKPDNADQIQVKLSALSPELEAAQVDLKKLEDKVTKLRDEGDNLARKAGAAEKEAGADSGKLAKAQDSKAEAKLKLEAEVAQAKKEARKEEEKMRQELRDEVAKKTAKIRKHLRNKAKEIIKDKWAEMKRTLKLKTVMCNASEETEASKLKRKLKALQETMTRITKSNSERRAKIKRKSLEEKRSKRWAKDQLKAKEKEFEHATELKEKKTVKEKEKAADAKVADAEKSEAEEKTIAKANEKKADIATAEAKAEADKLKAEEQGAAADKLKAEKPAAAAPAV